MRMILFDIISTAPILKPLEMRIVSCHCTLRTANTKIYLPDFHNSLSEAAASCSANCKKNKQTKGITEDWLSALNRTPTPFLCVNNTKPVRCFFPKRRKK